MIVVIIGLYSKLINVKNTSYKSIQTTQKKLNAANTTILELQTTNDSLNDKYETLSTDYDKIKSKYSKLKSNYLDMKKDYDDIKSNIIGYKNTTHKKLTKSNGIVYYNNHKETYYNLPMSNVVSIAQNKGYKGKYWIREDGTKMFGQYIMVAADYSKYPYGSIVSTSLGKGIILDTGTFRFTNSNQFDIATSW